MGGATSAGSPGFPEECLAAASATRNLAAVQASTVLLLILRVSVFLADESIFRFMQLIEHFDKSLLLYRFLKKIKEVLIPRTVSQIVNHY